MTDDIVARLRAEYAWYDVLPEDAADEIERLRAALRSIAANSCCDTCQEAALVSRAALGEKKDV